MRKCLFEILKICYQPTQLKYFDIVESNKAEPHT